MAHELWVSWLGLVEYREALELQRRVHAARVADRIPDVLLLLEHPPVYTCGVRTRPEDLPLPREEYERRGIAVHAVDRGGRVTYHGPGQLIGYPIVRVGRVREFVSAIERALVAVLNAEGVTDAHVPASDTGIWTSHGKIASIGIRVRDGVSLHGFALNVDCDLEPFRWIHPCGMSEAAMSSLALEGHPGRMRCVRRRCGYELARALGARQRLVSRDRLTALLQRTRARPLASRSRARPGGWETLELPQARPFRDRKPRWFKRPRPGGARYRALHARIEAEGLHTVCQEAACPNIGECWEHGTATFMILGDVCTRRCGFCNVKSGKPTHNDPLEPLKVARQVQRMGLRHAVVTSVDRDDLPDYGAGAFAAVIRAIRTLNPGCTVEVLTPDFRGQEMPLARVIAERPDVFNHNVETVPRLYPLARRGSDFARSCRVLLNAKLMGGERVKTKSGLMVGLGETREEVLEVLWLLREHAVEIVTIGQYLRPSRDHLPVVRYWHPEEFRELEREALAMGFSSVAAGPLVRSSYHAEQTLLAARAAGDAGGPTSASAFCSSGPAPTTAAKTRPSRPSTRSTVGVTAIA
ncbi:lipoyl synthase [Thermoleophilum album]|uniref:Multifunctional fusion protein n=1 Tax=Thermoleophilum album TaxID=29539 RepID=A0A1H6FJ83_THEAL|nr:lipoyl synthase [Thermoleophilum album]SEH10917.1 lipoic acid synthetase [Thermoleophilum album]